MKIFTRKKSARRFFLSYLSMLIAPIIIGVSVYISFETVVREQALEVNSAIITQVGNTINQSLMQMEMLSNAVLSSQRIQLFGAIDGPLQSENFYTLKEISLDLRNYAVSMLHVDDFFIYFPNSEVIMTKTASYSPELFFEHRFSVEGMDSEMVKEELVSKKYNGTLSAKHLVSLENGKNYLVFAKSRLENMHNKSNITIFFLLDAAKIVDLYSSYAVLYPDSRAAIMNGENQELLRFTKDGISPEVYSLVDNKQAEAPITWQNSIITSYSANNKWGLWYVMQHPLKQVLQPVWKIRNTMLLVFLIYSIVGITMAVIWSEKNYAPIRSLLSVFRSTSREQTGDIDERNYQKSLQAVEHGVQRLASENHSFSQRLTELVPIARNNAISALIQGNYANTEEAESILKRYGLIFTHEYFFAFILGDVSTEKTKNTILTNMMITDVLTAMLQDGDDKFILASTDNAGYSVLFNTPTERLDQEIGKLAVLLQQRLFYEKNIDISVYTGCCYKGLQRVHHSFLEAEKARGYHAVIPGNSVIEFYKLVSTADLIRFPQETKLRLEVAIRSGQQAVACEMIDVLFEDHFIARHVDPNMGRCLILHILTSIVSAADGIGYDLYHSEKAQPAMAVLFQANSCVEDTHQQLKSLVELVGEFLQETNNRTDRRMLEIQEFIRKELGNRDLSLSLLADRFGMSAPYFSAYFKEKFGMNMVEYIGRERCCLAQEYLKDPAQSLSQIAEMVGLSDNAALIRVFKKHKGITPGQYRQEQINE